MASLIIQKVSLVIFLIIVTNLSWACAQKITQPQPWAKTIVSGKEKTTTLQFYFHDTQSTNSPSVVQIAQPIKQAHHSPLEFGNLNMADDPLTIGPDPKSKLVGRAQGLYGIACQSVPSLVMALSYNFIDGKYNGSSISIMGRNSVMDPVREMPVVGGTGFFRMARGYAIAHTYWFNSKGDAIVGYNVTIVH